MFNKTKIYRTLPAALVITIAMILFGCCGTDKYYSLLPNAGAADTRSIDIIWLGTSGALISDGPDAILIDPYVGRFGLLALGRPITSDRGLIRKWITRFGNRKIRAVIVSHSHFDHSIEAPYFAMESGAPLIGSESTLNIGLGAGLQEKQMKLVKPGEPIGIGGFTLQFIESRHGPALFGKVPYPGTIDKPLVPPAKASDYKVGPVYAILIGTRKGTILHHGSAGFIPSMYDRMRSDIVLLGIAGRGDTGAYLKEVALKTGARIVIPVHFDNFFNPLDEGISFLPMVDFDGFCKAADNYRTAFSLKTLPIGKPVPLFP